MIANIVISNDKWFVLPEPTSESKIKAGIITRNPFLILYSFFYSLFTFSKLKVQNVRIDKTEPVLGPQTGSNQRIRTVSGLWNSIFVLSNEKITTTMKKTLTILHNSFRRSNFLAGIQKPASSMGSEYRSSLQYEAEVLNGEAVNNKQTILKTQ